MLNVGGWEILVILLLALIVLGPERLPEAARQIGKMVSTVRGMANGFTREFQEAASGFTDLTEAEARENGRALVEAERAERGPLVEDPEFGMVEASPTSTASPEANTNPTPSSNGTAAAAAAPVEASTNGAAPTGPVEPVPETPAPSFTAENAQPDRREKPQSDVPADPFDKSTSGDVDQTGAV